MVIKAFVKQYLAGENPLDTERLPRWPEKKPRTIVGVVGTSKHNSLAEPNSRSFTSRFSKTRTTTWTSWSTRARSRLTTLQPRSHAPCTSSTHSSSFPSVRPLTQLLSQDLTQSRFNTALLGAFAAWRSSCRHRHLRSNPYNVAQRTKEDPASHGPGRRNAGRCCS